jgi:hypothetical protein
MSVFCVYCGSALDLGSRHCKDCGLACEESTSEPLIDKTVMGVPLKAFLKSIKQDRHFKVLSDNEMTLDLIADCENPDLVCIGIPLGAAKTIISRARQRFGNTETAAASSPAVASPVNPGAVEPVLTLSGDRYGHSRNGPCSAGVLGTAAAEMATSPCTNMGEFQCGAAPAPGAETSNCKLMFCRDHVSQNQWPEEYPVWGSSKEANEITRQAQMKSHPWICHTCEDAQTARLESFKTNMARVTPSWGTWFRGLVAYGGFMAGAYMAVKYKIDGEHVSALYVFLVFLYVIFFTLTITQKMRWTNTRALCMPNRPLGFSMVLNTESQVYVVASITPEGQAAKGGVQIGSRVMAVQSSPLASVIQHLSAEQTAGPDLPGSVRELFHPPSSCCFPSPLIVDFEVDTRLAPVKVTVAFRT